MPTSKADSWTPVNPALRVLLQGLLTDPNHPEVLVIAGPDRLYVSAKEASMMLKSNNYLFKKGRSRLKKLKPASKYVPWQQCHRTCNSATIQPGDEYGRSNAWRFAS